MQRLAGTTPNTPATSPRPLNAASPQASPRGLVHCPCNHLAEPNLRKPTTPNNPTISAPQAQPGGQARRRRGALQEPITPNRPTISAPQAQPGGQARRRRGALHEPTTSPIRNPANPRLRSPQ